MYNGSTIFQGKGTQSIFQISYETHELIYLFLTVIIGIATTEM